MNAYLIILRLDSYRLLMLYKHYDLCLVYKHYTTEHNTYSSLRSRRYTRAQEKGKLLLCPQILPATQASIIQWYYTLSPCAIIISMSNAIMVLPHLLTLRFHYMFACASIAKLKSFIKRSVQYKMKRRCTKAAKRNRKL